MPTPAIRIHRMVTRLRHLTAIQGRLNPMVSGAMETIGTLGIRRTTCITTEPVNGLQAAMESTEIQKDM